mmetsp:Transcript_35249/g.89688  ORF Transcript_35249/g.89688 Transcript_35249/m.89688 type:complete len:393 (+) Transcript_35249:127-1305(+)
MVAAARRGMGSLAPAVVMTTIAAVVASGSAASDDPLSSLLTPQAEQEAARGGFASFDDDDDECSSAGRGKDAERGEEGTQSPCALHALQRRVALAASADNAAGAGDGASEASRAATGSRRRHQDVEVADLTHEHEVLFKGMLSGVAWATGELSLRIQGLSSAAKKANTTLFARKASLRATSTADVNATPETWEDAAVNVTLEDAGDDDDRLRPLAAADLLLVGLGSRDPGRGKAATELRQEVIHAIVTAQQRRLHHIWRVMGMVVLNVNWIGHYLTRHRRLFQSCPVLEQDNNFVPMKLVQRSKIPFLADETTGQEEGIAGYLLTEIRWAANQTEDLWNNVGLLERSIDDLGRRIVRHKTCKVADERCYESLECCSGSCVFDAKRGAVCRGK